MRKRILYTICLLIVVNGCSVAQQPSAQSKDDFVERWEKKHSKYNEEYINKHYGRQRDDLTLGMTQREVYERWPALIRISKSISTFGVLEIWEYKGVHDIITGYSPNTRLHFLDYILIEIIEFE